MTQEAQLKAYTVADYELAERLVDASNVVTCDGYYELDIKKVAQTLANENTRIESGVVAELVEAGKRIQAHNLCGDFTVHTGECAIAFGAFQDALTKLEASK